MPYRELTDADRAAAATAAARAPLERLAALGRERSDAGHRPTAPPRRPARKPRLPFAVAEDRANPIAARPGMTAELCLHVLAATWSPTDVQLVRHALWSLHPLLDARASADTLVIEIPSAKLADPADWLHLVIEDILPAVHACQPIHSARYGRVAQRMTR